MQSDWAKKIGEVLAFAEVESDTYERGKKALTHIYNSHMPTLISENVRRIAAIKEMAQELGVSDIVTEKSARTRTKLITMRDLYIHDAWNDPVELLEWSGFFLGAAIVHWSLVLGNARTRNQAKLETFARESLDSYQRAFTQASELISQ